MYIHKYSKNIHLSPASNQDMTTEESLHFNFEDEDDEDDAVEVRPEDGDEDEDAIEVKPDIAQLDLGETDG